MNFLLSTFGSNLPSWTSPVLYLYVAAVLMLLARDQAIRGAWMAWIPYLNLVLLCRVARVPAIVAPALFLPWIWFVVVIVLFFRIAKLRGKPGWVGLLIAVPVIRLFLPAYLAIKGLPFYHNQASLAPSRFRCEACGSLAVLGQSFCNQCGIGLRDLAAAAGRGGIVVLTACSALAAAMPILIGGWLLSGLVSPFLLRVPTSVPAPLQTAILEIPVDRDSRAPARPLSVYYRDIKRRPPAGPKDLLVRSLPAGITHNALVAAGGFVTIASFYSSPLPPIADVVVIAGAAAGTASKLASLVAAKHGVKPEPFERAPKRNGATYVGAKVAAGQLLFYSLERLGSGSVVLVFAPTPNSWALVNRLVDEIGNGAGLAEYRSGMKALRLLPPARALPEELSLTTFLVSMQREGRNSRLNYGASGNSLDTIEAAMNLVLWPDLIAEVSYEDAGHRDWDLRIFDFGNPISASVVCGLGEWFFEFSGAKEMLSLWEKYLAFSRLMGFMEGSAKGNPENESRIGVLRIGNKIIAASCPGYLRGSAIDCLAMLAAE